MTTARHNVAVLLAGGVGTRVGLDLPKQLIAIAGRPMLEHSLAVLDGHEAVDEILILMAPGHLDAARAIVTSGGYSKVRDIVEGGATRTESTSRALEEITDHECKVLFHDAARPLLNTRIVGDCYDALDAYDAVAVAIPSADTIFEVTPEGTISDIPPRASLRRGQTPQAFRARVIRRAYDLAAQDASFQATDDCMVVLRYLPDTPIKVVPGDERNTKVTGPLDLHLVETLLRLTTDGPSAPGNDEE